MIRRRGRIHPLTMLNYFLLFLLALAMFYPFWYVLMYALSSAKEVVGRGAILVPHGFTLNPLRAVLVNPRIYTSYRNTLFIVIVGTTFNLSATMLLAYPLSRRVRGHRVFSFLIYFTMLFSGGMIPTYYIVRSTRLLNTLWAVIIPTLVNPFYVFLVRNFFRGVPESMHESALIDGATELKTFLRIILPLCLPVVATQILMLTVGYWNLWFLAVLYIRDEAKQPLQLVLREMIQYNSPELGIDISSDFSLADITPTTIKMAVITISIVPVMCVYPFLQKYFVKGVTLGAVKG